MCREVSTTRPWPSDWPLVPVAPPRGRITTSVKHGSSSSLAIRTRSSRERGKATAPGST